KENERHGRAALPAISVGAGFWGTVWRPCDGASVGARLAKGSVGASGAALGPEIERDLSAFHVERQRAVLVDDAPVAIDPLEALRGPPEHADLLPIARRAADMGQAVTEGNVEGGNHLEAGDLVGHRPVTAVEPLLG